MQFIYFAQGKLERFYDFLVERSEEQTKQILIQELGGEVVGKGAAGVGSVLRLFGLANLTIEAEVSGVGKLSFSNETVSRFTPAQKLKALLLKLASEDRLLDLNSQPKSINLPVGRPAVYTAWLKVDAERRPEAEVERTGSVILTGNVGADAMELQASLQCMASINAWRRLQPKPRHIGGFGTLIGADAATTGSRLLEIDPIAFQYVEPPL